MTLIDFPKPKEIWIKPKTLEDWPWDKDLGKPYGDINGTVDTAPNLSAIARMEANDLARYKEPSIDALLVEREKTHGPYKVKAKIIQDLKCAMELADGWDNLNDMQRESLHMIAHKIGRILSGDPDCADHWDDVAGYARLVSKSL
jgi:ATP-dependent helicase YprA (DUF1998 family)